MKSILIPYMPKGAVWQELEYAARSIRKHCKEPYHIFVIGSTLPKPLRENEDITHIYHPGTYDKRGGYRARDINHKLAVAISDTRISDSFMLTYDDTLFNKPFRIDERDVPWRHQPPRKVSNKAYKRLLDDTINECYTFRSDPVSFETHQPRIFNKAKLAKTLFMIAGAPLLVSTMYGNIFYPDAPATDSKLRARITGDFEGSPKSAFINYADSGLTPEFKSWIMKTFPNPLP